MTLGDEIICERQGSSGLIVLDRPKALNALTPAMVGRMKEALEAWAGDPGVIRVVVASSSEKAFCAGGDVRLMHDWGRAGRKEEAKAFWREEYRLNALIHRYPKPYISLIDGIVMGGGVGISLHGSYRVASERYLFAMPEVGIGFFPDVGATYALPRLPGRTGMYLALTGERLSLADAVGLGLVTHPVRSGSIESIRRKLLSGEPMDRTLSDERLDPGPGALQAHRGLIDECFAADGVVAILESLDRHGSEFAARTAATIRTKSPTSLNLAFQQMRRGGLLSFEEAVRTEFRIVSRIIDGHDFYEGVRTTLIDKGAHPAWKPNALERIDSLEIERYFSDLGADELKVA